MKVNEVIRELIMKQANADQIREHAFDKSGRKSFNVWYEFSKKWYDNN